MDVDSRSWRGRGAVAAGACAVALGVWVAMLSAPLGGVEQALAQSEDEACAEDGEAPVAMPVEISSVPIVVESTTDDYFVLYVLHDRGGDVLDLPVLVALGEDGTTTLAENVEALPAERYRVEKYLISDPADVDGDCIDDIAELADPVGMNPVNPAASIEISDGTVAVPDQETLETLSYDHVLKFVLVGTDTDRPAVYFNNVKTHPAHASFSDAVGLDQRLAGYREGRAIYLPELVSSDGSPGVFAFRMERADSFGVVDLVHTVLAASMPLLEDNLAYFMHYFWPCAFMWD